MRSDTLREKFLAFFKSKKHKIVESDSLVPRDDPTILFTPAGMNQFKKEFLGFKSGFVRAATSQRCLRTDDLDKVGKTCGHHTFFEMLGNFSFGDYFKKEAIAWSWEFLTAELKIKKESLWVSVYRDDQEAYDIWRKDIGVPAGRIIKLGDKENFWPSEAKEKGPDGPCGPCSEIFYDQGAGAGCKRLDCNPSCSCGRFMEVWNLVFTQFNRKEGGLLEPLPNKNIDTGMGLERLAAVVQGVKNNFETDLFQSIIKEIAAGRKSQAIGEKKLIYAIADHIRAIAFAIYDGVLPSNETRGYVVRKLLRKSVLNLRAIGIKQPFLYKLVPIVTQIMQRPYPELAARKENIAEIILAEEKGFIAILESSNLLLKESFANPALKTDPCGTAGIAFQLYDTYGLPLEITLDWLEKHNIEFSQVTFDKKMEEQKSRSKLQSAMKGEVFDAKALCLDVKATKFFGFEDFSSKAKIIKIIKDNKEASKISQGQSAEIILEQTVFYPESGGQVGDAGEIVKGKNKFSVEDTKKIGKVIIHIGKVKAGVFKKGDGVAAGIDAARRLAIARNHTATHLLQAALKKVLGEHVKQQGSLVSAEKLRFDFTHFKDIPRQELDRIERLVNSYIIGNYPRKTRQMNLAQAKKSGALAFFGEKYEEKVRVVSLGGLSMELCGGTHLDSTGQIGLFKITQEGSVASGVRRIEAITGEVVYQKIKQEGEALSEVAALLGVPEERVREELVKRLSRIKELEKQLQSHKSSNLKSSIEADIQKAELINGVSFITHIDNDVDSVRRAVDYIRETAKNNTVILSSTGDNLGGKVFLAIGLTADLCAKGMDASRFIKEISLDIGGSGGGRKDFAQAGGNKPENFNLALQKIKEMINNPI